LRFEKRSSPLPWSTIDLDFVVYNRIIPSLVDETDIVMLKPRGGSRSEIFHIIEYEIDDGYVAYTNDYAKQAAGIFLRLGKALRQPMAPREHDVTNKTFYDYNYGGDDLVVIGDSDPSDTSEQQLLMIDPNDWEVSAVWQDKQYDEWTADANQDLKKILDNFDKTGPVPNGTGNNWIFNPSSTRRWNAMVLEGSNESILALDGIGVNMMLDTLNATQSFYAAINGRTI